MDADVSYDHEDPNPKDMENRLKEIEEEAGALREMQPKVQKEMDIAQDRMEREERERKMYEEHSKKAKEVVDSVDNEANKRNAMAEAAAAAAEINDSTAELAPQPPPSNIKEMEISWRRSYLLCYFRVSHIDWIFRSIDSNSVKAFPKNPKEAISKGN